MECKKKFILMMLKTCLVKEHIMNISIEHVKNVDKVTECRLYILYSYLWSFVLRNNWSRIVIIIFINKLTKTKLGYKGLVSMLDDLINWKLIIMCW